MTDQPYRTEREGSGGRVVVLLLLGLVVILGGLYVAAYVFAVDRVPRGATVEDVRIGGLTQTDARSRLRDDLAAASAAPLIVTIDGAQAEVSPVRAGISVDVAASVAAAGGGRSWQPTWLWDYYTGGDDLEAAVRTDEGKLAEVLERLGDRVNTPAREGDVVFTDGTVRAVAPQQGAQLSVEGSKVLLADAFLQDGEDVPALPVTGTAPRISEAAVSAAMNKFGNPAVSGPVTMVFDDQSLTLSPETFTSVLAMKPRGGRLVPDLDAEALAALVRRELNASTSGAPVDATVRLVDGQPEVVPARPGVSYQPDQIGAAFLDLVVTEPGSRTMEVESSVEKADFTTREARDLAITERVSTFTTYYPHEDYRNINLGRAAELIDGTLLKPGETFSLNETVGERTAANGFTKGFVISDGVFEEDFGGGVSQIATTTFNAAFFAGLEDVEHKPHSFYIDRYPVGREATVAWGSVDLEFTNDTPYGILIEAGIDRSQPGGTGAATVSMYSTKYWDITTSTSPRYNLTSPATRFLAGPECVDNVGYGGFDIDVYRFFRKPGARALERRETFETTYTPSDTVICEP